MENGGGVRPGKHHRAAAEKGEKQRKSRRPRKPPVGVARHQVATMNNDSSLPPSLPLSLSPSLPPSPLPPSCPMQVKSSLDYSAYLPPDWLNSTSPHSSPYFPQVGDIVSSLLLSPSLSSLSLSPPFSSSCLFISLFPHSLPLPPSLPGGLLPPRSPALHRRSKRREALSLEVTEDAMATLPPPAPGVLSGDQRPLPGWPAHHVLHHAG